MDIIAFVKSLGVFGIIAIVFAESGLLPAVILPGDSLLFAAGFIASRGTIDIWFVTIGCFIAAILGNCLGYSIGKKVGKKALKRGGYWFLKPEYIDKTEYFYNKYGPITIMIGRFLPVVRTFAPFFAGVVQMPYRLFIFYSTVGAFVWVFSLCWLGFYLGQQIKGHQLDEYLTPIVIGIILILLCPTAYHILKDRFSKKRHERTKKMGVLVLLRHGQSQWNLENRFTGLHDVELSPLGQEEAVRAGQQIAQAGIVFDAVFTSTLKRAAMTAELALNAAGQGDQVARMIRHDDLRERDYGDLTGLNKDETKTKYGEEQVYIWRRSYDVQPPGGESLKDVVENRVRPYYTETIKPLVDAGENVMIAAHGNSLRALLIILGENTPENINETEIPTGSPLVLEFDNGKVVAKYYLNEKLAA